MDAVRVLIEKFPSMWQGQLVLKNDSASVRMLFVHGNKELCGVTLPPRPPVPPTPASTPPSGESEPLLRISQRMRLETAQVEGVAKRMEKDEEFSLLLAIPSGANHAGLLTQSSALNNGFICYLQQKQAAGIVNIPKEGSSAPGYVVHIFPPCEFSEANLMRMDPHILPSVKESHIPFLVIIITTCQ